MSIYEHEYLKYKARYLTIKIKNMKGGGEMDPQILQKIDEIAKQEIKNLKMIGFKDLCGLTLRVYERPSNVKEISPILFIPQKIENYMNNIGLPFDAALTYGQYYEEKYGDITKHELKNLMLNFDTYAKKVKVAFADNYHKGIKQYFEINLPITLVDFINKLFDHFDEVSLVGYPDNGGIDTIKYDEKNDIYLVGTWS